MPVDVVLRALASDLGGYLSAYATPVVASTMRLGGLIVVGRWRLAGWCLAGAADLGFVVYGAVFRYPVLLCNVLPLLGYLRLISTRWRESWHAIPTSRELHHNARPHLYCCVHRTPLTAAAAALTTFDLSEPVNPRNDRYYVPRHGQALPPPNGRWRAGTPLATTTPALHRPSLSAGGNRWRVGQPG